MNYRAICKTLGHFLFLFTLILLVPIGVGLYYEFFGDIKLHPPYIATLSFVITFALSLFLTLFFRFLGRKTKGDLYRRESILLVPIVWLITSVLSALPFLFSNTISHPIDALFESVSGLTTTGSSVIYPKAFDAETGKEVPAKIVPVNGEVIYAFHGTITPLRHPETGKIIYEGLDAVSRPILFWRSFIQWLGGLGIIFVFIAILPALAIGGKFLYEAELTGPFKETITPRIKETASYLWKIYLALTVIEVIVLRVFNHEMPLFDAFTITFSNISTGGFSIHENNIGFYRHHPTEWVVMFFMLLGAINFTLYYHAVKGKVLRLKDRELGLFLTVIVVSGLLITWQIFKGPLPKGPFFTEVHSVIDRFRTAMFQLISSITCTGFFTANYDLWPYGAQAIMLICMFIGGMSCSTSGGIKIVRHMIILRAVKHKIESLFRPESVREITVGKKVIPDRMLSHIFVFFWVIIAISALCTLVLLFNGIDPRTALGLVACSVNNVGLSFSAAGPSSTCAFLPPLSKIVMILGMLLGRLEFFAFLILLAPSFWKSH